MIEVSDLLLLLEGLNRFGLGSSLEARVLLDIIEELQSDPGLCRERDRVFRSTSSDESQYVPSQPQSIP